MAEQLAIAGDQMAEFAEAALGYSPTPPDVIQFEQIGRAHV